MELHCASNAVSETFYYANVNELRGLICWCTSSARKVEICVPWHPEWVYNSFLKTKNFARAEIAGSNPYCIAGAPTIESLHFCSFVSYYQLCLKATVWNFIWTSCAWSCTSAPVRIFFSEFWALHFLFKVQSSRLNCNIWWRIRAKENCSCKQRIQMQNLFF